MLATFCTHVLPHFCVGVFHDLQELVQSSVVLLGSEVPVAARFTQSEQERIEASCPAMSRHRMPCR